jgi:hypothetical protein
MNIGRNGADLRDTRLNDMIPSPTAHQALVQQIQAVLAVKGPLAGAAMYFAPHHRGHRPWLMQSAHGRWRVGTSKTFALDQNCSQHRQLSDRYLAATIGRYESRAPRHLVPIVVS